MSAVLLKAGEGGVKLIRERSVSGRGDGVALSLVCDVLYAFHGAGVVFPELGLYLLSVFCFGSLDASPVGLPVF